MLTLTELRKLEMPGLDAELHTARLSQSSAEMSLRMKQSKETHLGKKNGKYVAQILTVKNELQKEDKNAKNLSHTKN
jgi:ribosomal protein L29